MHPSLRRMYARSADLLRRARQEHSTPREVGWSVGIGVFFGCTPFIGFHMWFALGLATLLRLNRLWAFVGSRISTSVMFSLLAFAEIELAHRLRFGAWLALQPRDILAHWRDLAGDWVLGCIPVGGVLAVILGFAAYGIARRWRRETVTPNTPDAPRPRSSESPPTAPRAPTA